jgi:imidazolonepropionase-like amidohydrolase
MYEKRKLAGAAPPRPVFDVTNVRKLHAAGVRQVLGNDAAGDGNRWLGLQTLLEFENMVAAGFTPMEMIVAATRDSAKVLRLDQLGTVAVGKSADFVVLDADPSTSFPMSARSTPSTCEAAAVDRAGLRAKWQAQWRAKEEL